MVDIDSLDRSHRLDRSHNGNPRQETTGAGRHPRPIPHAQPDRIGEALAFALKAALEGGPALASVLKVGIRGARDNMLSSPDAVDAYLSVCDTSLRLLNAPNQANISEFLRLLSDILSCARGIARATRKGSEKGPWLAIAERAHQLQVTWSGSDQSGLGQAN